MRFILFILLSLLIAVATILLHADRTAPSSSVSEHEAGFDTVELPPHPEDSEIHPRLRGLETWKRPEGPRKVALQVGHWKAAEAPEELKNLRVNTGASYGHTTEWETALAIAEETKKLLEPHGIIVEILPVTIPPNYWSDVFVSLHADGNTDTSISGYKVAAPRRDHTERAENFADILENEYEKTTSLTKDPSITRAMRGYYAFNWNRYEHSLHPMTVAAIVEMGFLTNARDRRLLVEDPGKPAQGIAEGILRYFENSRDTTQTSD